MTTTPMLSSHFPPGETKRRLELIEELAAEMELVRNSLHHPSSIVTERLRAMVKTIARIIGEIESGHTPRDTIIDTRPPSVIVTSDLSHLPPPPPMPAISGEETFDSSGSRIPRS